MSIISKITMPNGNTYDVKDEKALRYVGVTTTALDDGSTTNPITVDGQSYTAVFGDVVKTNSGLTFLVSSETAGLTDNIVWTQISASSITVENTYDPTSTNAISGMGVADALETLPEPMIFKGGATLTADSFDTNKCSIAVLDPAQVADIKAGYTYKITTIASSPKYTGDLKVGDTLIAAKDAPKTASNWAVDTDWTIIPSADEKDGTVLSIAVSKKGLKTDQTNSNPIETTGTISLSLKNDTASALTATAKGSTTNREYAVGLDLAGDLSVNIPWTDTTYTAKDGIQISGLNNNEIGHINSITPKTTSSLAQIKFDAQGHITESAAPYSTTVVSDVKAVAPTSTPPQGALTYWSVSNGTLSLFQIYKETDSTIVTTTAPNP